MQHDTLAAALSNVMNHERASKKVCVINPTSKVMKAVFKLLNTHNYIGIFEEYSEARGGSMKINLIGNINAVGAITPRFAVQVDEFEKFEKRFLPAKDVGVLVVSTNQGIMTHTEAKEKNIGGKLLAYCY
ncbi:MAG: 30S ribosomal protein S8 [Nanoarchaeota archaeon]